MSFAARIRKLQGLGSRRGRKRHRSGSSWSRAQALGSIVGVALLRGETASQRARFAVFVAFIFICFGGGGGSRDDILSLLYLRPAAIICLAAILAIPGDIDWKAIKVPLLLLTALTAWIAVQLVPLPPAIWTSLPGRELFASAADVVGIPQPWRPISLAPDLTLNSLAAMVVPFAALIGFASLTPDQRGALLLILLVAVGVSALFGIAQLSSGPRSAFHLYRVTNDVGAVGLFANRNHQAALLAMAFPMLACWAAFAKGEVRARLVKRVMALAFSLVVAIMILVTGSRAGLVLGAIAALWGAFFYVDLRRARREPSNSHWKTLLAALALLIGVGLIAVYFAFSRAESLHRLTMERIEDEQRLNYLPYLVEMVHDYFPAGSGFGTFDPVFRIREPLEILSPAYLNHAHNDLLELIITGGLPAAALLLVFIAWYARESFHAFRPGSTRNIRNAFAQLGAFSIFLLFTASLVDYPLRTPALAAFFAIACGWLGGGRAIGTAGAQPALRSRETNAIPQRPSR